MADIEWGASLTGVQMKLLRAAGLPDGVPTSHNGLLKTAGYWAFDNSSSAYRLPADHPAYTLLEQGWLDGRNVALWLGGDKAPDDWDGGGVLLRGGLTAFAPYGPANERWAHPLKCGSEDPEHDIIAYIRKAETITLEKNRDLALRNLEKCGLRTPAQENVTLAKMTEAEGQELAGQLSPENWRAVFVAFKKLGLIKIALTPEQIASTMLAALEGLDEGILERALNSASGMPEWEAVSAKVKAARDAIALAKGGVA